MSDYSEMDLAEAIRCLKVRDEQLTAARESYDYLAGRVLFWCSVTGDGQTPEQAIKSHARDVSDLRDALAVARLTATESALSAGKAHHVYREEQRALQAKLESERDAALAQSEGDRELLTEQIAALGEAMKERDGARALNMQNAEVHSRAEDWLQSRAQAAEQSLADLRGRVETLAKECEALAGQRPGPFKLKEVDARIATRDCAAALRVLLGQSAMPLSFPETFAAPAPAPEEPEPQRVLPCGCVTCVCKTDDRCLKCDAHEAPACQASRLAGGLRHVSPAAPPSAEPGPEAPSREEPVRVFCSAQPELAHAPDRYCVNPRVVRVGEPWTAVPVDQAPETGRLKRGPLCDDRRCRNLSPCGCQYENVDIDADGTKTPRPAPAAPTRAPNAAKEE